MTPTECLIVLGLLDVVAFLMFVFYGLCIGLAWLVTWPFKTWRRHRDRVRDQQQWDKLIFSKSYVASLAQRSRKIRSVS